MERVDELKISTITDYGLLVLGEHDELWGAYPALDAQPFKQNKKSEGTQVVVLSRTELSVYLKRKKKKNQCACV